MPPLLQSSQVSGPSGVGCRSHNTSASKPNLCESRLVANFMRSRQDATRPWSTQEVRWWTASYIKAGNAEDVKFARIQEIFAEGTQFTKQLNTMVFEAWTILLEDGVWKVRVAPGVRIKPGLWCGVVLKNPDRLLLARNLKPRRSWARTLS